MAKKMEKKRLSIFRDERGSLFEMLRRDDKLFGGMFGQVLVSTNKPGVIKAWHMHEKQTDYTCCVKGKILFATATEKKGGKAEIKKIVLEGEKPVLVKVPPKVWHGYKVIGKQEAIVVYVMDIPYNAKNPDEQRKPLDAFGSVWE